MVRVDRLYLGPMFAPEPMGSDQLMVYGTKLGSELLPAPEKAPLGPSVCPFLKLGSDQIVC
jgi:hypothetical protein